MACVRQHLNSDTDEAVATHFQQNTGKDDRARCWRFNVRVWKPCMERPHGGFDGKGSEEGKPQPQRHFLRELAAHHGGHVRSANMQNHRENGNQHEYGTKECVEEEFIRSIGTLRTTPHTDDKEHRDKDAFEEQIEQNEIK